MIVNDKCKIISCSLQTHDDRPVWINVNTRPKDHTGRKRCFYHVKSSNLSGELPLYISYGRPERSECTMTELEVWNEIIIDWGTFSAVVCNIGTKGCSLTCMRDKSEMDRIENDSNGNLHQFEKFRLRRRLRIENDICQLTSVFRNNASCLYSWNAKWYIRNTRWWSYDGWMDPLLVK